MMLVFLPFFSFSFFLSCTLYTPVCLFYNPSFCFVIKQINWLLSTNYIMIRANDIGYGEGGAGSEFNPLVIHLALIFTITGTFISLLSVWLHWKNYRKPASTT
ncbi:hypothetical protein BC941DRAFT_83769 [Chlamydoabsidia padenii]|nr:hypothetical protein BC941DRAFT_83769 [Chlamydoabsidia padenii]